MNTVHRLLGIAAAVLGLAAAVDGRAAVDGARLAAEISGERDHITAPELADRIIAMDPQLHIVDLRPRADYEQLHIPTAVSATLDELPRLGIPRTASIVLYSEGGVHSAQGWMLLRLAGYRDVRFLREGIYEWLARVIEPRLADDATPAERADFTRAERHSRFFGGQPRSGVPRSEVPVGYWTGAAVTASAAPSSRDTVARIRRRGC